MTAWKKFRLAFTIFTGLAIISVYAIKGTFSSGPRQHLAKDINTFYTTELNHCNIMDVIEVHVTKNFQVPCFTLDCKEDKWPFLIEQPSGSYTNILLKGSSISKKANDFHFAIVNASGESQFTMIRPDELRLPIDWEFPIIMGSFLIINLCIFFIFPKRYFSSEDNPK